MPRIFRGPNAYRHKAKRRPRVMPCPQCSGTDWLVDLATAQAECLTCGSVFSRDYWHQR